MPLCNEPILPVLLRRALQGIDPNFIIARAAGYRRYDGGRMVAVPNLASLELFRDVPAAAIQALSSSVSTRVFEPNTVLMSVGHNRESLYLILSGTVKVH